MICYHSFPKLPNLWYSTSSLFTATSVSDDTRLTLPICNSITDFSSGDSKITTSCTFRELHNGLLSLCSSSWLPLSASQYPAYLALPYTWPCLSLSYAYLLELLILELGGPRFAILFSVSAMQTYHRFALLPNDLKLVLVDKVIKD